MPQSAHLQKNRFLCQNFKRCAGVAGFNMLDMFAALCARSQMIDVTVEANCPNIRYTKSAYHFYGNPGNSGENSNGTVHHGGNFPE